MRGGGSLSPRGVEKRLKIILVVGALLLAGVAWAASIGCLSGSTREGEADSIKGATGDGADTIVADSNDAVYQGAGPC